MAVYIVMNDMGVESVYGYKRQADKRADYLNKKYEMDHWVKKWDINSHRLDTEAATKLSNMYQKDRKQALKDYKAERNFGEDEDNDKDSHTHNYMTDEEELKARRELNVNRRD